MFHQKTNEERTPPPPSPTSFLSSTSPYPELNVRNTEVLPSYVRVRVKKMDVAEVQAIPGRSANSPILHVGDGYFYHVREVRRRRIRLKCRHLKKGCKANACLFIREDDLKLQLNSAHSCQRDLLLLEDMRARAEVVAEARTSVTGASVRKLLRDFRLR